MSTVWNSFFRANPQIILEAPEITFDSKQPLQKSIVTATIHCSVPKEVVALPKQPKEEKAVLRQKQIKCRRLSPEKTLEEFYKVLEAGYLFLTGYYPAQLRTIHQDMHVPPSKEAIKNEAVKEEWDKAKDALEKRFQGLYGRVLLVEKSLKYWENQYYPIRSSIINNSYRKKIDALYPDVDYSLCQFRTDLNNLYSSFSKIY